MSESDIFSTGSLQEEDSENKRRQYYTHKRRYRKGSRVTCEDGFCRSRLGGRRRGTRWSICFIDKREDFRHDRGEINRSGWRRLNGVDYRVERPGNFRYYVNRGDGRRVQ